MKDHSDFAMEKQVAKDATGESSRMQPPFLQFTV